MKFVTMIPLTRNDGSQISNTELHDVLNEMVEKFGGFTIEGTVDGGWFHDGKTYREQNWKVSCVCENDRYEEAKDLVIRIGRRFGQIEMFFEVSYFDGVQFLKTS